MSTKNFIPEMWNGSILANFRTRGVLVGLANRQYEASFRAGDTLHIPGIVDVKIKDYKAAGRTTTPDDVEATLIDLAIDQEKNFDFLIDDIDRAQANQNLMTPYVESAAAGLLEDAEEHLTAVLAMQGTNVDGAAAVDSPEVADAAVMAIRSAMTKAKVPMGGRKLVVNAEFEAQLLAGGGVLSQADTAGSAAGLREATIGRYRGFDVVVNPFDTEEKPRAIGLLPEALAYVSQIEEIEAMRADATFADRIRGLHVYGSKVIRPLAVQIYTGL